MRIIGIDPGLQATGWGVIASEGAQLKGVSHGIIRTNTRMSDPERLLLIFEGLQNVIANHQPETAIIEEIFVKDNPRSALRLGLARGVAILACGQARVLQIKNRLPIWSQDFWGFRLPHRMQRMRWRWL